MDFFLYFLSILCIIGSYFFNVPSCKIINNWCSNTCTLKVHHKNDDDDHDDDEGRINFSVALSLKTTRTRNNKLKQ